MTLADILLALKWWWWVVLLAALAAALPTYAVADGRDPVYESVGRFVLAPGALDAPTDVVDATGTLDGSALVATFSEIVESETTRRTVGDDLDLSLAELELYDVDAAVVPEALVVEFEVSGPRPELAQILAEGIAADAEGRFEELFPIYRAQVITPPELPEEPRSAGAVRDAGLAGIAAAAVATVVAVSLDRRRRQRWELAPVTDVRIDDDGDDGDARAGSPG